MIVFFIASLPRSRTAWLANFLTYGPSYCFHEPMNDWPLLQYPRMLAGTDMPVAGVSDSINTLVMEQLIDLFPQAKVVVIRRKIKEVAQSLRAAFKLEAWDFLNRLDHELDRIEHAYSPLVIPYEKFDPAAIWRFIMPEVPCNLARLRMLANFQVTVPPDISVIKGLELMERAGGMLWPLLT